MRTRPPRRRVRRIVREGDEASSPPRRRPRVRCRSVLKGQDASRLRIQRVVLRDEDEAPSPSSAAHRTRRRGGIVTSAPPPPTSADVLYSEASSLGRRGLVDSSEVGLKVCLKRGPPRTRSASSEVDLSLGLDEVIEKIHACLSRVLQHTMIHVFLCSLASNYKGVQNCRLSLLVVGKRNVKIWVESVFYYYNNIFDWQGRDSTFRACHAQSTNINV